MGGGVSLPAPHEIPLEDRKKVLSSVTLDGIAACLKGAPKDSVLFLAGSGISVSAGLPSFRGAADSLFGSEKGKALAAKHSLSCPEDLFNIDKFRDDPRAFYELSTQLFCEETAGGGAKPTGGSPSKGAVAAGAGAVPTAGTTRKRRTIRPTVFHIFMRLLQEKGILKRVFTMNVDCLERRAGIDLDRLVEAHGSFAESKCTAEACGALYDEEWLAGKLMKGDEVAKCDECGEVVKPSIVFYGEGLPARYHSLAEADTKDDGTTSLLIVAGTSLAVAPVNRFPGKVGVLVPRLLINRDMVDFEEPPAKPVKPAVPAAKKTVVEKKEDTAKGAEGETEVAKTAEELAREKEELDVAWKGAVNAMFGSGTNTSFRFLLSDNYRDVFYQGDADAGAVELARKCGWLDELKALYQKVVGPELPAVFNKTAAGSRFTATAGAGRTGASTIKASTAAKPAVSTPASKPIVSKPAASVARSSVGSTGSTATTSSSGGKPPSSSSASSLATGRNPLFTASKASTSTSSTSTASRSGVGRAGTKPAPLSATSAAKSSAGAAGTTVKNATLAPHSRAVVAPSSGAARPSAGSTSRTTGVAPKPSSVTAKSSTPTPARPTQAAATPVGTPAAVVAAPAGLPPCVPPARA